MEPTARGLYDPSFEHDACGIGLVCNLNGLASSKIISQALEVLERMDHRGACGCDPESGDGGGIMTALPQKYFAEKVHSFSGLRVKEEGVAVGMLFMPRDPEQLRIAQDFISRSIDQAGFRVLKWRPVPHTKDVLGSIALKSLPSIWQVVFDKYDDLYPENELYSLRRSIEQEVMEHRELEKMTYISSFSSRTIVYKGMLKVDQIRSFYPDLSDPDFVSSFALVHSRFSTNTFPSWEKAQPFRKLCHNGEINTLRGNVNRMRTREALKQKGDDRSERSLTSVLTQNGSDSMILDNAVDWLVSTGKSLPHAMMMLVPEAWEGNALMDPDKKAFYEYHACLMEPWDGPAAIPFADGRYIGAVLDRNGLRPCRYLVTDDDLVVLSSEVGVLDIPPSSIRKKGRVEPGKMFLVDLLEKRIIEDDELKMSFAKAQSYRSWVKSLVSLRDIEGQAIIETLSKGERAQLRRNFGYTLEDLKMIIAPMGETGKEALGSMGNDTPLAVLSDQCRPLFDYFKQLFAQVTNPPLDAIREELVTSMFSFVGRDSKVAEDGAHHCQKLKLVRPVLSNEDLSKIRTVNRKGIKARTISLLFAADNSEGALLGAIEKVFLLAEQAIDSGATFLILSDRGVDRDNVAIPSLLAVAALHHRLIESGRRGECGIIVESGEVREVHHFCCLLGYGASAINPYLTLDSFSDLSLKGSRIESTENYLKAATTGVRKVMSKMGISTLESYRGAQMFEAVGLSTSFVKQFFPGTTTRIEGIGLGVLQAELMMNHSSAFQSRGNSEDPILEEGGIYQWRRAGEDHHYTPLVIASLQNATRSGRFETYKQYADLVNSSRRNSKTLRGLLEFSSTRASIPIKEVEPWTEIVKRFKTGAMSYGSISSEAHRTLAVAMNQLGGKSNTGEGGEEKERHDRSHEARSRIKQVASGRFGVTLSYLASADEIQIKMAQGAKPGEGGQLPGEKVFPWIAKTRHSTPFVGLISPPPHHDIYSIEDLAQLIFDLKNTNPSARLTVKLVSEAGIGTVAAGVAKGKADVILVSGYDGGTGASPKTSIMHAGLPWELGLAETNQTLVLNGLRNRVKIECDGQLKTGKDVIVAALLGADEYGFATAPLVSMGCVMMRKCHLNTCPVGIATQDEQLRKKFAGKPENVVNYFHFVAEEMREIMAELGFRNVEEMIGQVEYLKQKASINHRKARAVNLSNLLFVPKASEEILVFDKDSSLDPLPGSADEKLIAEYQMGDTCQIEICNEDRTLGTMLSAYVNTQKNDQKIDQKNSRKYAEIEAKEFEILARGSGGQSAGAFLTRGVTLSIEGETNDYLGKGLSGGTIILKVPKATAYEASENIIAGNVAFYGATSGKAFLEGIAGERFCVRNSGATVVVEGVGDHGCEYMTGGRVAILGSTGRNFGAGMSGGYAYVYDADSSFEKKCNLEMVRLDRSSAFHDDLKSMIEEHLDRTGSQRASELLRSWSEERKKFVRVIPVEYEKVMAKTKKKVKSVLLDKSVSPMRMKSA